MPHQHLATAALAPAFMEAVSTPVLGLGTGFAFKQQALCALRSRSSIVVARPERQPNSSGWRFLYDE